MMKHALFQNLAKKASIVWSEPISYDDFTNGIEEFDEIDPYEIAHQGNDDFCVNLPINDKGPNFYMILGKWGYKPYKLFYIGKTEVPLLKRVNAPDHIERRSIMHEEYKKHKLFISKGHFLMGDWKNKTKKKIDEIESLLIYVHEPTYNKSKVLSNNVSSDYWIKNCGSYEPLYSEMYYGLVHRFQITNIKLEFEINAVQ